MAYQPELPEPWLVLDPARARRFQREASLEIGPGHDLAGHTLTAIAQCGGCDEVLFQLDDGTFALVHLTWALHPENGTCPDTRRFTSQVAAEIAADDHATWHR